MTRWMLAAGAAALAIASPGMAQNGGHGDKGQGHSAKGQQGGGQKAAHAKGGGGQMRSASHGKGGGDRMQFAQRGEARHKSGQARVKVQDHGRDRARVAFVGDDRGKARGGHGHDDVIRLDRGKQVRFDDRGRKDRFVDLSGDRVFKVRDVDRGVVRFRDVDRDELFGRRLGYGVGGCPPGLAKKGNGCMPPGQAAKFIGQPISSVSRLAALDAFPRSMNGLFLDNDDYYYRYGGGYAYRVDRGDNLISGLLPLFGAALIGQPLQPNYINSYNTPPYFNAFYPNSPYDCYQNGYGYVYETDCMTGMVEDVIPTYGYGYGVGQMMPSSYSYYNVPYNYRSSFADNDDYYYRYAPGAIYQVDRGSSLISAVAALLTGGLSVGQPLPTGYSAYNVPLAYRDDYYDTPDMMYRYDNGYIYAVDPGTRVVRSVAYTIV
jgi:hypothetical protein